MLKDQQNQQNQDQNQDQNKDQQMCIRDRYFNLDKNKEALKFFATYVESASYPMLADKELAKNDTLDVYKRQRFE